MECNKDEALRAKSIAESKLEKKDFAGARKFALKAQTLYPGLDGTSQLLMTVDVYISSENKISGEVDWYGVLGVNPAADDETIKKQYRKLALTLHPDKNKSVGADGAFTLISEAFNFLSDKAKRLAYNQRRGFKGFQQKVSMQHAGGTSAAPPPSRGNGVFNFASRTTTSQPPPKPQNKNVKVPGPKPARKPAPKQTPPPSSQRTDTFWTICHRCKMQYEYLKIYLNHTLLCTNCNEPFLASPTPPPVNFSRSSNQAPRQRQQTSSNQVPNQNQAPTQNQVPNQSQVPQHNQVHNQNQAPHHNQVPNQNAHAAPASNIPAAQKSGVGSSSFRPSNYQQVPLSGKTEPSIGAKAGNAVLQEQNKLKRAHTESLASEVAKKRKISDDSSRYGVNYNMAQENGGFGFGAATGSSSGSRFYGFSAPFRKPNSTRELTIVETRRMLIANGRKEIQKRLSEWGPKTAAAKSADKEKNKTKENQSNAQVQKEKNNSEVSAKKATQGEKRQVSNSADHASEKHQEGVTMNVPDPDFHDFDLDRTESSFQENEVWSAYDDDDGMPRFYALIIKVLSQKPFKLRVSWLNSKTNTEFSNIDWVDSGFYKTCGEFRMGKYEICKSINAFSQKVSYSKGPRGSILILPQKDDVWALYKNWSSDWNEHTSDEVVHKYDMVMVLDDYSEEKGISVAPLVKVVGFRTIFRPNMDSEGIKRIPREEMFRFSHRVPHHLLTGEEAENVSKGCLELDPAATPLDLLQIATETNQANVTQAVDAKEQLKDGIGSGNGLADSSLV